MSVTLNGHVYDASQFYGYGYLATNADTGLIQFPNSIFSDMLAELAAASAILSGGISPSTAGNVIVSDGTVWRRSQDGNYPVVLNSHITVTGRGASFLGASRLVTGYVSGIAVNYAYGPDASTNGRWQLLSRRSDDSNSILVMDLNAAATTMTFGTGILAGTDGAFDWGASASGRFRDGFISRNFVAGGSITASTSLVVSGSNNSGIFVANAAARNAATIRTVLAYVGAGSADDAAIASFGAIRFFTNNGAVEGLVLSTANLLTLSGNLTMTGTNARISNDGGAFFVRDTASTGYSLFVGSQFAWLGGAASVLAAAFASKGDFRWYPNESATAQMTLGTTGALTILGAMTIAAGSGYNWSGRSGMSSPADGIIALTNAAGTSFSRLQFGGTTASFPSLRRQGAGLEVRLADDSDYGDIGANTFIAKGPAGGVGPGQVDYGGTTQTTVGVAGTASVLPAIPAGYLIVNVAGTDQVLPFYNK